MCLWSLQIGDLIGSRRLFLSFSILTCEMEICNYNLSGLFFITEFLWKVFVKILWNTALMICDIASILVFFQLRTVFTISVFLIILQFYYQVIILHNNVVQYNNLKYVYNVWWSNQEILMLVPIMVLYPDLTSSYCVCLSKYHTLPLKYIKLR